MPQCTENPHTLAQVCSIHYSFCVLYCSICVCRCLVNKVSLSWLSFLCYTVRGSRVRQGQGSSTSACFMGRAPCMSFLLTLRGSPGVHRGPSYPVFSANRTEQWWQQESVNHTSECSGSSSVWCYKFNMAGSLVSSVPKQVSGSCCQEERLF